MFGGSYAKTLDAGLYTIIAAVTFAMPPVTALPFV
jgi:hypothetical protein